MLRRCEPAPLLEEGYALILLRDLVKDALAVGTVVHRTCEQLIIFRFQAGGAVLVLLDAALVILLAAHGLVECLVDTMDFVALGVACLASLVVC